MDGGAQHFHFFLNSDFAGFSIEFYESGTDTPKDVWLDEAKSTAVQSIRSDSYGMARCFADGDYKLIIKKQDTTVLWTFDNVKITSDTATMWEGNFGYSFPTATNQNIRQMFMTIDAAEPEELIFIGVNNGSSFQKCCQPIGVGADIEPSQGGY